MRSSPMLVVMTASVLAVPSNVMAGGVSPTSSKVVSANANVSSCGSLTNLTISWTVVDNVVTSIALASIPSTCNGGSLSLTFVNSSSTSVGSVGPVVITGTSQTFNSITDSPAAASVANAYVSVVGP